MGKVKGRKTLEVTSLSAVDHILTHNPSRIRDLQFFCQSKHFGDRVEKLIDLARQAGLRPILSSKSKHSNDTVRAFLHPFEYANLDELIERLASQERVILLALDHLQDPQNLGALARTAEGLGAGGILIPKDRGVGVGSGTYAASVGAIDTLPICQVVNLADNLEKLKKAGYWIVGSAVGEKAKSPWEIPDFEKVVLVLGAEFEGLSGRVSNLCDWLVEIPIVGKVESLNVSNAGAILLYELFRRSGKGLV